MGKNINEQLIAELDRVRTVSSKHPQLFASNEQAVRVSLIDPILDALGWPVRDPDRVRVESVNEAGKVPDYSFYKNGIPVLLAEAKSQKGDLGGERHNGQLFSYCTVPGVKFGVLTNGIKWILVNAQEFSLKEDRVIWSCDIATEPLENVAKKLESISHNNIDSLESKWREIFDEERLQIIWDNVIKDEAGLLSLIMKTLPDNLTKNIPSDKISKFISQKIKDLYNHPAPDSVVDEVSNFVEVIEQKKKIKKKLPRNMRVFIDNREFTGEKQVQIFLNVIQYIGIERVKGLEIKIRKNGYLINDTKPEPEISKFYKKFSNFWIYVNLSYEGKERIIKMICKKLNLQCDVSSITEVLRKDPE